MKRLYPKHESSQSIPEYHKLELSEIFQKTRLVENIRIQLGTFIGTVNLSALGVAFSSEKAGIVVIASGTLLVFVAIDVQVRRLLRQLYERGIDLENQYSPDPQESILNRQYGMVIKNGRIKNTSFSGFWAPIFLSLGELAVAMYLYYEGWALF